MRAAHIAPKLEGDPERQPGPTPNGGPDMRSPADTMRQPFLAAILARALGCAAPEAGTDDAMAEAEPAAAE